MKPVDFPESNCTYHGDPEQDIDDVESFVGTDINNNKCIVCCWEVTPQEIAEIARTGKLWLHFYSDGMPVHALAAYNPFSQPTDINNG